VIEVKRIDHAELMQLGKILLLLVKRPQGLPMTEMDTPCSRDCRVNPKDRTAWPSCPIVVVNAISGCSVDPACGVKARSKSAHSHN
jgi:hypothetical protein